ncbi:hypothetical protein Syn7803C72_41 [Synechococcus phage ACG-2014d]|jgi:hypothetical protein|uniref:Uncharacterized protein n=1 Tax=Synechococcus phage ACG-2014d TaxID=1493509 RepID=A0A0E3HZ66_9CAUD|nr:hypothetical protein AAJ59_gp041 [Synechococcus phage ACG-2014d]YP_010355210.1 hypothetical protein M1M12_gp041 [Synechococcus phage ACG-2014d]AIX14652.1 hypothetical protein Syn7803C45_41 [Synechococcus phage ACG-2014d]AIX14872.1 hypothetical protein Syn7803C46_41 [Synechococcus phage ACG-2014d]AIX15946.1 hypothetical protein Syn7803C54_41 [Synechococcus phage ACG-2014d]AIX16163.1 hypothetical protein Syn7803C55_38 [Synechococcus phage ACG-2014d]AIX16348.1 hypothetical protein Syn7803C57_
MSAVKQMLYEIIKSNMQEDPQMCYLMEEYIQNSNIEDPAVPVGQSVHQTPHSTP